MATLNEVLQARASFPHGLFWFIRPGEQPLPAVVDLIQAAKGRGVQAAFVEVSTFDELMADLFLPHQDALAGVRDLVKAARPSRQPIPISYAAAARWPVLRTNALQITDFPASCTIFQAKVGNTADIKAITRPFPKELVALRRKAGVIAFGARARIAEVFAGVAPTGFDRYPIEHRRLRYDSAEVGLLYHAIAEALVAKTGLLRSENAKGRFLFAPSPDTFTREEIKLLTSFRSRGVWSLRDGVVLHEGFELALDFRDNRFWMLLDPTLVVTADGVSPYLGADRSAIAREPLVTRYNKQRNDALSLWIAFLSRRCGNPLRLAFPSDGQREAEFTVSTVTAYSRGA
jgi:hypothetical protein